MRLPDAAMESWFSLLAVSRPPEGTGPRDAKRALARGIVERFHGAEAAAAAEQHFDRVFVTHEAPAEVDEHAFSANGGTVHVPGLISDAFGRSRSEARRLLSQGGVKLDGEALGDADMDVAPERLDGRVLQVGKRHFVRLRLTP
jgi:tyrosyl-tRNA synthetase